MKRWTINALVALIVLIIPAFTVFPTSEFVKAPRIVVKEGTSTNWSGYAVPTTIQKKGTSSSVTDVKGWWIVPTAQSDGTGINTWSANWVGIDGYNSSSVEQLGTESDWYNGAPRYYAWFEMYPKPSYLVNQTINASDLMFGEVQYVNGSFILTLKDYGSNKGKITDSSMPNWTFTLTQKSGKATLSSAEWVVEAPWSGGVLPLTNFGTTYFSGCLATIGGSTKIIGGWTNYDRMDMVVSSTNLTLKDQTTALGVDGASFSVTWHQSQ